LKPTNKSSDVVGNNNDEGDVSVQSPVTASQIQGQGNTGHPSHNYNSNHNVVDMHNQHRNSVTTMTRNHSASNIHPKQEMHDIGVSGEVIEVKKVSDQ